MKHKASIMNIVGLCNVLQADALRFQGQFETTLLPGESNADACRRLGFKPGTRIVGNEGHGNTVIEITAIGERSILAKEISHNGEDRDGYESVWSLDFRMWLEVPKS
jgi:hypothetical protein